MGTVTATNLISCSTPLFCTMQSCHPIPSWREVCLILSKNNSFLTLEIRGVLQEAATSSLIKALSPSLPHVPLVPQALYCGCIVLAKHKKVAQLLSCHGPLVSALFFLTFCSLRIFVKLRVRPMNLPYTVLYH